MLHRITLLPSQLKSHIKFMQMVLKTENCYSIAKSNVLFIEYIHSFFYITGTLTGKVFFFHSHLTIAASLPLIYAADTFITDSSFTDVLPDQLQKVA